MTAALTAYCELNEDGKTIAVFFPYSEAAVEAIRAVPGRRFRDKPRKHWTIPADLTSANRLREEFGTGLRLGDRVRAWGREQVQLQRNLGTLTTADDAQLDNLPESAAQWLRPYQRADVKMMSLTNVLNANQPGVGKTVEVIYAVQEAQIKGPHLVIAPLTLHKDPWMEELQKHAPGARVLVGSSPEERRGAMNYTWMEWKDGKADDIWLIINPDAVRAKKVNQGADIPQDTRIGGPLPILSRDHKGNAYVPKDDGASPQLFEIQWGSVTLDEFHKHGLGEDRNTLYARAVAALGRNAKRRFALSGTPMGGKPIRLWGCLHYIEPDLYTSKWRWAEQWLMNKDGTGPVQAGAGTGIGDIIPGREEAFYKAHAKHMVRRTRKDALPGLPDKVIIDVHTPMTKSQRKLYTEFAEAAEAAVEGGRITGEGILAEFARLKQLANARCEVVDGDVVPTKDSGKLEVLLERLDEFGLRTDNPERGARAIVASESKRFVEVVADYLEGEGLSVRRLTGAVTGKARDAVIDWYKEEADEARILVMTTQTGGVGLNLGMTGSIHILDETWNPDDQEQLEDRGMRNRTTPLMCLYYRTEDSIQQYIAEVAAGKRINNKNVLDLARQMLRAT
jgi:SNF2 family DNA or RNA helicase